ncbi:GNAT family N-acetyltransferase [Streptomyces sp. NBC_00237]|uniref:GNAT family N-acetyltransferase n=1 Tax=Streptomyces sp. NBC_00237 TaxID=2975687 RepID=UPI002259F88F|nr:GNAT family N-acetyltransferase [Streptomyces sp. NBC_00237]MCX5202194.1 GNAT family N-acetyltransferase [Streptomyces sp. NBC_00237]
MSAETIIREYRPGTSDAESVLRVRRLLLPFNLTTAESVETGVTRAHPDSEYRLVLAEDGGSGEVAGVLRVGIDHQATEPGHAFAGVLVPPGHRRRGIGSALLRYAEEYVSGLGAVTLRVWALDEQGRAFAKKRGWALTGHSLHFLGLDLTAGGLPGPPPLPAGFVLRDTVSLGDDPRALYEADAEVVQDEPNSVQVVLDDYEDWLAHDWNDPLHVPGLSTVAVAPDGRIAAFTTAHADDDSRYKSGMTGVRRDFRGLGLAKAVKVHSLRKARAAGFRLAITSNDDANGPMRAVNTWFGYEHGTTEVEYVRSLG